MEIPLWACILGALVGVSIAIWRGIVANNKGHEGTALAWYLIGVPVLAFGGFFSVVIIGVVTILGLIALVVKTGGLDYIIKDDWRNRT